jgi:hypothetical protein
MSIITPPTPASASVGSVKRTITILEVVRIGGTILYLGAAALMVLAGIGAGSSVIVIVGIVCAIIGALWYAVTGWFVDSLGLLSTIAANTARSAGWGQS